MKSLIVCMSPHKGNTMKVANEIARVLDARIVGPGDISATDLKKYDLVGFGSGIYMGKHHKEIMKLVDGLPEMRGRKVFIFSTSGASSEDMVKNHFRIRKSLEERGLEIVGDFNCRGFFDWFVLKLIGGRNKGRPNREDLGKAARFARKLKEDLYDKR